MEFDLRMPIHSGNALNQINHNCFIHSDAAGRPRYLVGEIYRQATALRPGPPNCLSGFDTAGTPFAKGHIMALELGGCDIGANIVPQYELWQGSGGGAWRDMEVALGNGAQQVMVVEIDYAVVGDNYVANKLQFNQNNLLIHWTSPNIPTRFRVWAVASNSGAGAGSIANYLVASNANKDLLIDGLMAAMHGLATFFDETIGAMPVIDRNRWKIMMVKHWMRTAHAAYALAATAARNAALNAQAAALAAAQMAAGLGRPRSARIQAIPQAHLPPPPPLPPEPLGLAPWSNTPAAQQAAALAIQNNTANASIGWTAAERQAFTAGHVVAAMFV
ncbi:hypothetical protein HX882_11020 [Pseudomonas gingeri]|uniref:Uncharacterized protein n=2 Tax=Pseudomonas gingeri TaxID=117681 RepID=A0A7Y8C1W1_9PSED|nr:hypothetical protein [Pseudomonas gingeri]NWB96423.1 hypothetical protein [Pseudomonas gingeri]